MQTIDLPDASALRRRPYVYSPSSLELVSLVRSTFEHWILAAALRRATTLFTSDWLLDRRLALHVRRGPTLQARVRDMGGPLDVFGLGAYDFAIDWSKAEYVVDAGANIGSFTLFAAARGARRFVAIEPHPLTFAVLTENIQAAGLASRVTLVNHAVAATSGRRTLSSPRMSTAATLLSEAAPGGRSLTVDTQTLGDIFRDSGWPRIDVLKIDIEGAEYEVFGDVSADFLAAVDTVLVECHHIADLGPSAIAASMRGAGFYVAAQAQANSTILVGTKHRLLQQLTT